MNTQLESLSSGKFQTLKKEQLNAIRGGENSVEATGAGRATIDGKAVNYERDIWTRDENKNPVSFEYYTDTWECVEYPPM